MTISFKDNYTAFGKKYLEELEKLKKKPYVKVGFPAPSFSKPREDDALTVGEVAVYNEFGTETIPERSFIRTTFDEKKYQIQDFIDQVVGEISDGKYTTEQGLERIGLYGAKLIVEKIRTSVPPPNAPSTIARKGSSNTLVDTGQMVQTLLAQGFEIHLP